VNDKNIMFTGIIEHSGTIESLDVRADGGRVTIHAPRLALAVSGSIAVNGCCLTITSTSKSRFSADLSVETLRRTSFGTTNGRLTKGARVNIELPLTAGKEFGGHFVLGHIDSVGHVAHLTPEGENWCYGIEVPDEIARYIVPKGSITIDGVSFTVARRALVPSRGFPNCRAASTITTSALPVLCFAACRSSGPAALAA